MAEPTGARFFSALVIRASLPCLPIGREHREKQCEAQGGRSKMSVMGKLLDRVMVEASKLPDDEQEAFAAFMLAELESERRWDELFSRSQDLLAKMADEARQEYRAGLTEPLDPDTL